MMFETGGPCPDTDKSLALVNAIFNGFQTLLLVFLSHWTKKNGYVRIERRAARRGPSDRKDRKSAG